MWWLLAAVAGAATTPEGLQAAWTAAAPSIAALGPIPFDLSAADRTALAAGEAVAHRVDTETGSFAAGAVWVEAPMSAAWIAVQDAKDRPLGRDLFHETLPGETAGHRLTYMRMPLPWPVADRQWVTELSNNRPLFDATGGTVWQRRWTLEMGGAIPDSVSRSFAISTVKSGLRTLVTHASDMATHYRGDHEVVVTPDNAPIPLWP